MGECENGASLQVQGVSGEGPASKGMSPLQSRSFWPVVVGAYACPASRYTQRSLAQLSCSPSKSQCF